MDPMKNKVLVTGASGQVGSAICELLQSRNIEFLPLTSSDVDITSEDAIKSVIFGYRPNVVIHCAAYTNVDKAEIEEKSLAFDVNTNGTRYIAEACETINSKVIYMSTDYVLNNEEKFELDENEEVNPINWYGYTKLMGEEAIRSTMTKFFILRISWVIGNGNNFIKTMLRLANSNTEVKVVEDQYGSPTFTTDLAPIVLEIMNTEKYGIYNITNEGFCSWADIAEIVFEDAKIDCKVLRVKSDEFMTIATRPKNSRLSKDKLLSQGFTILPNWQDSALKYLGTLLKDK